MPLDRDGLMIMANPPESFPAFLVMRLCEPKPIRGSTGCGIPRDVIRPPLASQSGGVFKLNSLGRAVLALTNATPDRGPPMTEKLIRTLRATYSTHPLIMQAADELARFVWQPGDQ